jgi:hypothetical protein
VFSKLSQASEFILREEVLIWGVNTM